MSGRSGQAAYVRSHVVLSFAAVRVVRRRLSLAQLPYNLAVDQFPQPPGTHTQGQFSNIRLARQSPPPIATPKAPPRAMGSDLARLVSPQDADSLPLPPFRNLSPGPPDSLPSLNQLGCDLTASAPPSWTAVNHRPPSSSIDSILDRAPNHDSHHTHDDFYYSSTITLQHQHSPLRPNSISHLGRRIHRPKLAPKSRQDSAIPESPSPKGLPEPSPEAAQAVLSRAAALVSDPSEFANFLAPSPLLESSLCPSHSARTAIYTPNYPRSTLDRPCEEHHPPSLEAQADQEDLELLRSFPRHHPSPGEPTRRALRKSRTTHPRTISTFAPTPAPSLPYLSGRAQRGLSSVHMAEQSATHILASDQPSMSVSHLMPPPPPLDPQGEYHLADVSEAIENPSTPPPFHTTVSNPEISGAHEAKSRTFNPKLRGPATGNGHVKQTVEGDSQPESTSLHSDHCPSPTETTRSSPETEPSNARVVQCRRCDVVYEPLDLETAHAQFLAKQGQTQSALAEMVMDHEKRRREHYDDWIEEHQHDSLPEDGNIVVQHRILTERRENTSNSHKRKRSIDDDHNPHEKQTHYAFNRTSGETYWVSELMARVVGGDEVQRQPYEPPLNDDSNMWYIPKKNAHDQKSTNAARKQPEATPSEPDASETPPGHVENTNGPSRPRWPTRNPGAAPLEQILQSSPVSNRDR